MLDEVVIVKNNTILEHKSADDIRQNTSQLKNTMKVFMQMRMMNND